LPAPTFVTPNMSPMMATAHQQFQHQVPSAFAGQPAMSSPQPNGFQSAFQTFTFGSAPQGFGAGSQGFASGQHGFATGAPMPGALSYANGAGAYQPSLGFPFGAPMMATSTPTHFQQQIDFLAAQAFGPSTQKSWDLERQKAAAWGTVEDEKIVEAEKRKKSRPGSFSSNGL